MLNGSRVCVRTQIRLLFALAYSKTILKKLAKKISKRLERHFARGVVYIYRILYNEVKQTKKKGGRS